MIPAFIVPTLMHYDLLQVMLDSVDEPIGHLIVIDNGGKLDDVRCDYADKISVVNLPSNIGVAASWNLGIKLTPFASWWLISNDDIIWNSGKLSVFSEKIEPLSIVSNWTALSAFSGFAIDEETIEKVGLFDEFYYPGCGEETNYLHRARNADIAGIVISEPFLFNDHMGRTRKSLNDMYPKAAGIIMNNLGLGIISAGSVRGWSLKHRRDSDPTV